MNLRFLWRRRGSNLDLISDTGILSVREGDCFDAVGVWWTGRESHARVSSLNPRLLAFSIASYAKPAYVLVATPDLDMSNYHSYQAEPPDIDPSTEGSRPVFRSG